MRATLTFIAIGVVGLAVIAPRARTPVQINAATVLADARRALGGDARLAAVRTFRLKGTIVRSSSGAKSPTKEYGAFDIVAALPDRFLETQSMSYPGSGNSASFDAGSINPTGLSSMGFSRTSQYETLVGFNGPRAIYDRRNTAPSAYALEPRPRRYTASELDQVLPVAQKDFVQVTLGLFVASFSGAPVTFDDLPSTASDRAIRVTGPSSSILRFDPLTHLPASLDGLEYLDYREVNGIQVPFRLRTRTTEWQVHDVSIDAPIDAKTFRPTDVVK